VVNPALTLFGADAEQPPVQLDAGLSFDSVHPFDAVGTRTGELMVLGNERDIQSVREIILLLTTSEDANLPWGAFIPENAVVLRVTPDDQLWHNDRAPIADPHSRFMHSYPNLLISETAARQLLAEVDLDFDELKSAAEAGERVKLETGRRVQIKAGLAYEDVTGANVI
ncbi:MAG: hypothetical protein GY842_09010, partial [bacterium]|nr:hypothetical protein [bacterium]